VTPRRPDELQTEWKGESFADLLSRQPLRVEQVVDVVADISRQMALLHNRGVAYGVLDSRHIRISGDRACLAPVEPAAGRRTTDDVRDFAVWLRGLAQALPDVSGDRRRIALDEIAGRYLQPQSPPVSTQMKKAAMALSLLRVTSHRMAAPEAALVRVSPPAAPAKSHGKRTVLLLVRVVSAPDGDETMDAATEKPPREVPWAAAFLVAAFVCAGLICALFYFLRGVL
jgi:hypothetical protein